MSKSLYAFLSALVLTAPVVAVRAEEESSSSSATAASDDKQADKDSDADESAGSRSAKKVRLAHIVVEGGLPESPGEMSLFGDLGLDLRKTMARLEKAGDDDAIAGIVLTINTE